MARPIEPTPVLKGREARKFLDKIEKDLKCPAYLISTPKLENARELVRGYAKKGKKHI